MRLKTGRGWGRLTSVGIRQSRLCWHLLETRTTAVFSVRLGSGREPNSMKMKKPHDRSWAFHCHTFYCRSGNFHIKNKLCFVVLKFCNFVWSANFLNGWDGYSMDEWVPAEFLVFSLLPGYWESQVLLAVVIDRIFTSGGVDLHAHTHHHWVSFFSCV